MELYFERKNPKKNVFYPRCFKEKKIKIKTKQKPLNLIKYYCFLSNKNPY